MTEDLVVSTLTGKVRGKIQQDYHGGKFYSFSGIPYAKAPIGELRFKAPQPVEPWEGIWNGTKEGWECPSVMIPTNFQLGKEDNCLNLNVYTKELPKTSDSKRKPVMVFIHGGSFLYGSNRSYIYGPHHLMTEDIVLVNCNFRLGVLGFLSLEDQSLEVPGNAGLKDQILALQWIQKNIERFGGDANNVTVFGESSGSASVHYLILSPLAKGLFHKAILQSGSALNPWAIGRRNGADISKLMGYNAEIDEKTLLQKLTQASTRSIISAQCKFRDSFFANAVRPFGPVIEYPHEGALLTDDPEDIMKAGKFLQIPVIVGYNSIEGLMFELLRQVQPDVVKIFDHLKTDIPFTLNIPENSRKAEEMAEKLKRYYYKDQDITEENINSRYKAFGDTIFLYGIQKTIRLFKKHSTAPIYVYRMTVTSSLNFFQRMCQTKYHNIFICLTILHNSISYLNPLKYLFNNFRNKLFIKTLDGASHGDDVFYLFTSSLSSAVAKGTTEDILVQRFVKLWTSFAECGDPTPEPDAILNSIKWNEVASVDIDNILEIGNKLENTKNLERERILFLEKLYEEYS